MRTAPPPQENEQYLHCHQEQQKQAVEGHRDGLLNALGLRGHDKASVANWSSVASWAPTKRQMPHLVPCSATLIGIHFLSDLQMKRTYAQITEVTCQSP